MRPAALVLVPLVLVMVACGSDDEAARSSATPPPTLRPVPGAVTPDSTGAPTTPPATGPHAGGSDEAQAIADLAARQHVDPSTITTVAVDEVTWRDGSIGCPQPGVNYTQALVPGTRVVLELDGRRYEYHAGGGRPPFLCADPQPPVGE